MAKPGRRGTRLSRPLLTAGAAVLLAALVLGSAAFSLTEIEQKALAAAEAEGLALLGAVSTGVERSLMASRAVEGLLRDRLLELARGLDDDLARSPGREERILKAFLSDHRLMGAVLLDPSFRVRVAADGSVAGPGGPAPSSPLSARRLTSLVAEDLVRRAREGGLGDRDQAVVGFGENPFGTRVEFLVGARLARTGGWLLIRQDAERLATFRREEGVERFLADAARADGIAYLLLQGADGTVLAASDPVRIGERLPAPTGRPSWREGPGGRVLDVSVPVDFLGEAGAALSVGLAAEPVEGVISRGRRSVAMFAGLALLLGLSGGAALLLMDRARRRREEGFEREMRARERAVAMGRLSAGVAHEVRSPLNAIGMAAQRLAREAVREEPDPARVREISDATRREVARLNRIVEDFLDLGRNRPLDLEELDVGALVGEVVAAEDPPARAIAPEEPVRVRADREELRKALANLVRNARQAAGDEAVVVAWCRGGEAVEIEVRDGGPGIPPEDRERIFEHFYTGRSSGTGLGLAVVRAIAEKHGGGIRVDDAPEGGARFTLAIPDGGEG